MPEPRRSLRLPARVEVPSNGAALRGLTRPHVVLGVLGLIGVVCLAAIGVLWFNSNAVQRLLSAIERGEAESVRREITRGVDLNRLYEYSPGRVTSPLVRAAEVGDAEIVGLLLDAGADANLAARWRPLIAAALMHADFKTVKLLIEAGADVNVPSPVGVTALHGAAYNDEPQTVRLLLEAGARLEARDGDGMTPLMWAASMGAVAAAEALVELGADVDARGNRGQTALMQAAAEPKTGSLVEFLVSAGAEVDARDKEKRTALAYAAECGCVEAAEALIDFGADVSVRDTRGMTPLMYVGLAYSSPRNGLGDPAQLIKLLLEAGADAEARDNDEHTALWHARERGAGPEVVTSLERALSSKRP